MKDYLSLIFVLTHFWFIGCDLNDNENTSLENQSSETREYFVFIGNSVTGKSALINHLIGKKVAREGTALNRPFTTVVNIYKHKEKYYVDTPGLNLFYRFDSVPNIKFAKNSAIEIESALSNEGLYRLFFIVKPFNDEITCEQIATINTTMKAIKERGVKFNVIINKVDSNGLETTEEIAKFWEELNVGEFKTDRIYYSTLDVNDKAENNDDQLKNFICNKSHATYFAEHQMGTIDLLDLNILEENYNDAINQMKINDLLKPGNAKFDDTVKRVKQFQAELLSKNN